MPTVARPLPLPPPDRAPSRAPGRPPGPPTHALRSGMLLLAQARQSLADARAGETPGATFAAAHLAALRCAAAVVALRARPDGARRRPTNAWVLLTSVAPELGDWAQYFAAGAERRAAVEAGATRAVSARDADDLLRAAGEFSALVEGLLLGTAGARAS